MTQPFDIVVVGAGMVGAALAAGLGQSGFTVALVDQAPAPEVNPGDAPDLRVSALSAGSERHLKNLGAWPAMAAMRVTPYRRLSVWDQTPYPLSGILPRPGHTTFDARELGHGHLGHIVENQVTQKALWDTATACDHVTAYAGLSVDRIDTGDTLARVTLSNHEQLAAALVVGADGAQSRVRTLAGLGVSRDQYAQQALVASVRYSGQPEDITWQAFYPSGPRAFLPLHAADTAHESWASLVWYDSPATLAELKTLPDDAFLKRVQQAFPDTLPPLTHVAARASFPIARQHANAYVQGRTVLVGDAAHTINPLAGQGVNLGFQDAQCLQAVLREARRAGADLASDHWLQQYQQQRMPANRRMMLAMDVFYYLFSNQAPPLHLIRNAGLALAQRLPFARNQVARYAMGLDDQPASVVRRLLASLPKPSSLNLF